LQGDIYVRGYVYFQSPTNGGSKDIQRKIYYLKKGAGSDCSDPRYWSTGLTTDATPGTGHLMQLRIWYFDCVNGDHSIFSDTNLDYDTWYAIEFHVHLSTAGLADGAAEAFVNGNKVISQTNVAIRGNNSDGVSIIEIGRQADRDNNLYVFEDRYLDDIVISAAYIGP